MKSKLWELPRWYIFITGWHKSSLTVVDSPACANPDFACSILQYISKVHSGVLMHGRIGRKKIWNKMNSVSGLDSAVWGYTGSGSIWATDLNFSLNHASDAGSISQPIDLQSSTILLGYNCPRAYAYIVILHSGSSWFWSNDNYRLLTPHQWYYSREVQTIERKRAY